MKRLLITTCVAVLGLAAFADDPSLDYSFTYQAALRDEVGNVISNAGKVVRSHELIVRLWNQPTGGNLLWGRRFSNVFTDETGLFNLEVSDSAGSPLLPEDGTMTCASLADALSGQLVGGVYIGIQVHGSDGEISPRQKILSVPYAGVANEVRQLKGDITVGGKLDFANGFSISPDGIRQSKSTSDDKAPSSEFYNLQVSSRLDTGSLAVNGQSTFNGGPITVIADDVKIDAKNTLFLTNATTTSISTKSFEVNASNVRVDKNGNAAVSGNLDVGGKLTLGSDAIIPVPIGGIIMWTKNNPPIGDTDWATANNNAHWAICDGTVSEINGTKIPDLHGRFIVGASDTGKIVSQKEDDGIYSPGVIGGTNKVALTKKQMPNHDHYYVSDEGVSRCGGLDGDKNLGKLIQNKGQGDGWKNDDGDAGSIYTTSRTGGNATDSNAGTDGNADAHQNLPPYYALFYIMRVR